MRDAVADVAEAQEIKGPKDSDRSGACEVNGDCSKQCDTFMPAGKRDGFMHCDCGHTRWAHGKVAS